MLPISQGMKATADGGRTGNEVDINGEDEFEITRAESYRVLIPKGDHDDIIGVHLTSLTLYLLICNGN